MSGRRGKGKTKVKKEKTTVSILSCSYSVSSRRRGRTRRKKPDRGEASLFILFQTSHIHFDGISLARERSPSRKECVSLPESTTRWYLSCKREIAIKKRVCLCDGISLARERSPSRKECFSSRERGWCFSSRDHHPSEILVSLLQERHLPIQWCFSFREYQPGWRLSLQRTPSNRISTRIPV